MKIIKFLAISSGGIVWCLLSLLVLLVGVVPRAHAADMELSFGQTSGTNGASYSLGMTGLVRDGLRWRVGYANLGTPSYNRAATPLAAQDDIAAGEGAGPYTWTGTKADQELYATVAPEWRFGSYVLSVEGGLGIYQPQWHQDLNAVTSGDPHTSRINFTPIVAVSVGYGKTSLVLQTQRYSTYGDNDNGLFPQTVTTILIRQRF